MAETPKHTARAVGLSLDCTRKDIKRPLRKMAFGYHPDRCSKNEQAARHMARINASADTLAVISRNAPARKHWENRHVARTSQHAQKPSALRIATRLDS